MRRSCLLAFVALGLGCGDSAGPGVVPKIAVATGGGDQALPTGSTLPVPLSVLVTGSDDRPLAGATVTWTVPTGIASLSPTSSTTGASGSATTTLTLGGQIGPVVVHATVAGISPVPFTATALDPCQYLWPYNMGTTVARTLANTDCLVGASYYTDFYGLAVPAQQGLTITMSAPTFGPWIDLYGIDGDFVGFDGDSVVGTSSLVEAIVAPGSYVLGPNTFFPARTGAYTLSTAARPQTLSGCPLVWVTRGIMVTDAVAPGDCTDAAGTSFADVVMLIGTGGSVLTVAERSAAFDAYLTLFDGQGTEVAFNDDSASAGTTTDAYLVATLPATDVYFLVFGTAGVGERGPYTFAISGSTTLSQSASPAPPATALGRGRRDRAWRLPVLQPPALTRRPSGR